MIAAMFLRNDANDGLATKPFTGEEAATPVGGLLLKAGRFDFDQFAKGREHARQLRPQQRQESF
jgi:hypothetical protein